MAAFLFSLRFKGREQPKAQKVAKNSRPSGHF